jgi:hypothetical protein
MSKIVEVSIHDLDQQMASSGSNPEILLMLKQARQRFNDECDLIEQQWLAGQSVTKPKPHEY